MEVVGQEGLQLRFSRLVLPSHLWPVSWRYRYVAIINSLAIGATDDPAAMVQAYIHPDLRQEFYWSEALALELFDR